MNTDSRNDEVDQQPGPAGYSGPSPFLIMFGVVAVATAVFILQNRDTAPLQFLWLDRQVTVWVAIVISIALGIILDRLILGWWRRSRRRE